MIWIVLTGVLSGIISGMGIGGGTVLIPALTIFLNINQHTAQGINLLYFIPTAIVSLIVHIKNKKIEWKTAFSIIITGVIGAALGALLALKIEAGFLRKVFGVFLFAMGLFEFFKKKK